MNKPDGKTNFEAKTNKYCSQLKKEQKYHIMEIFSSQEPKKHSGKT